jgi:RNA polymerase sigma-70 factor (ECF subfamily)
MEKLLKLQKKWVAKSADKKEFEKLALVYLDDLYRMGLSFTHNKADAEDLVQRSVMKAYRAFQSFERGTNMKAWLFKILRNTFISDYRRNKKHAVQSIEDDEAEFSFYKAAQEEARKASESISEEVVLDPSKLEYVLGDEVKKALDSLSDDFREAIFLCDVQGLSYVEMAEILDVPVGTVRSRLARARGQMQKVLWEYAKDKGLWRRKIPE